MGAQPDTIRTFVAIDLAPAIREELALLLAEARCIDSGLRWTRPEALHITLAFLGNLEAARIEAVVDAVRVTCTGITPIELQVHGFGAFPDLRRPRAFFVGVSSPHLPELAQRLAVELRQRGFTLEQRDFKPHITLARVEGRAGRDAIAAFLQRSPKDDLGHYTASNVNVYRSTPQPRGSLYTVLASVEFAGPAEPSAPVASPR